MHLSTFAVNDAISRLHSSHISTSITSRRALRMQTKITTIMVPATTITATAAAAAAAVIAATVETSHRRIYLQTSPATISRTTVANDKVEVVEVVEQQMPPPQPPP